MNKLKAILASSLLLVSGSVFASGYGIMPSHSADIHPSDKPDYRHGHHNHEDADKGDIHAPIMPQRSSDR